METNNKIAASKELSGFTIAMKEKLLNGKIITQVIDSSSDDIIAKFTEMEINGDYFYAIWERNIYFNEGWRLLKFGTPDYVEPEWNKYLQRVI